MAGEFATDYDGTSDFLSLASDLDGDADSKVGIFSVWVRIAGANGTSFGVLANAANRVHLQRDVGNKFQIFGVAESTVTALTLKSTTSYTTAPLVWLHVLASWTLSTGTTHLYVNDVDDNNEVIAADLEIEYTRANWNFGSLTAGNQKFNGDISEAYFNTAEYLDFSVESNRRKFISTSGKPVPLGPTGNLPTGTAAIIYAPDGNPAVNQGTGGNFTENGAPVRVAGPGAKPSPAAKIYEVVRGS